MSALVDIANIRSLRGPFARLRSREVPSMSRYSWRRGRVGGSAAFALLTCAASVHAATDCSTLPGTIIYGAGGSAQEALVAQIASQLAALPSPISIVYNDTGSACVGYQDLVTPTSISGGQYWDTGLKQLSS